MSDDDLNLKRYVLISPCRNEEKYMLQTLNSVIAQSIRPTKWVIVDDGSTDSTQKILLEYSFKHPWISIVTREDRGHRAVGPGVIDAFYAGFSTIDPLEFEYICKLDLDLDIPPRYFQILIEKMENNPRIATCSGKSYIYKGRKLINEGHGDETSLGMTKFYRMSRFQEIGGFVREVMWDGIDCHRCRMLGFVACSWDEPELRFIHLRPEGSSQQNVLVGRMRHGYGQYFMGTGLIYMLASSLARLSEAPVFIGSIAMFWGWLRSYLQRKPRYQDVEFRKFLRKYQFRALLVGKKRAIAEIDGASGA